MADNEVKVFLTVEERKAIASLAKFEKRMKETGNQAAKSIGKADIALGSFAGNLAAGAVTKGLSLLSNGISEVATQTRNFDKATREISTILPKNTRLTEDLKNSLVDLSVQFGTDASDQAKSFYQIISAGITDTTQAMVVLEASNALATGGLADLETTITGVTKVVSVYGDEMKSAEDISDVFFRTVQLGQTRVEDLASALPEVLSISKAVGVSFEDMSAAVATLTTRAGSTAQAVTQLRAIFVALSKNQGRAKKLLGENADAFSIAALKAKGLVKFLDDLKVAAGDQETLTKLLGRVEALNGVLNLGSDGFVRLADNIDKVRDRSGITANALGIVTDGIDHQIKVLESNFKKLALGFGRDMEPAATGFVKTINSAFGTSQDEIDKTRVKISVLEGRLQNLRDTTTTFMALDPKSSNLVEKALPENVLKERERDIERIQNLLISANDRLSKMGAEAGPSIPLDTRDVPIIFNLDEAQDKKITDFIFGDELKPIEQEFSLIVKSEEDVAGPVTTEEKIKELTDAEKRKLEARKKAMAEGNIELNALKAEQKIVEEEAKITELIAQQEADQADIQRQRDLELEKINIKFEAEEMKAKLIKDVELRKIKQQQIAAKREIEIEKTVARQEAAVLKARQELQQKFAQGNITIATNAANLAAVIAKDGSKAQFLIQQGTAIAQSVVATNVAVAKALASAPWPANLGLATQAKIAGGLTTATIAATTIKGFQDGGIVGGNSFSGDRVLARVNSGEAILNQTQQRNIIEMANNGGAGGNVAASIAELAESIQGIQLSLSVGTSTVAKTVREARKEGFEI